MLLQGAAREVHGVLHGERTRSHGATRGRCERQPRLRGCVEYRWLLYWHATSGSRGRRSSRCDRRRPLRTRRRSGLATAHWCQQPVLAGWQCRQREANAQWQSCHATVSSLGCRCRSMTMTMLARAARSHAHPRAQVAAGLRPTASARARALVCSRWHFLTAWWKLRSPSWAATLAAPPMSPPTHCAALPQRPRNPRCRPPPVPLWLCCGSAASRRLRPGRPPGPMRGHAGVSWITQGW